MIKLRIGIVGTRGVPNQYGGFEQFASFLSQALVQKGHTLFVYSTHNHPYKENKWNGVQVIHCYDPSWLGTAGQFIYDLNCILDARRRSLDILLVLGYTSSSVWGRWYPEKAKIITNMDGLEWKRSKYSKPVQQFLLYAEKLAMKFSDYHVADSPAIQAYLQNKYNVPVEYISYGAEKPLPDDAAVLVKFHLQKNQYHLLVARMEPENNIETILDGLTGNPEQNKVIVIGNTKNAYAQMLVKKYSNNAHIIFIGAIYDKQVLDTLRSNCLIYFHGHSVGGTNPSLLEAMACKALICAHDNPFNRSVLNKDAIYFSTKEAIKKLNIHEIIQGKHYSVMKENNQHKIRDHHTWPQIVNQYENLFIKACHP